MVIFAVLAWLARWMSDDGLIVLRTVRQLLAGNGPVFNIGERVETNTSVLWTALLTLLGGGTGLRLEWLAVGAGLVCSVTGLAFGLHAAWRLHGRAKAVAPAGALVVCVLPPFRDFATSGLETGLMMLWLGASWWLLVRCVLGAPARVWPVALVLGLGPLVRPELALFGIAGLIALLVALRPRPARAIGWLAVAGALPVVYQVFRMGYYGLLIPNTALAKEASMARWGRGWTYLADATGPYLLWIPLLALALAAGLLPRRGERRVLPLVLAPVLAGCALALYVLWVGGDFMHARMVLPPLFCLLLPVFVLPVTRRTLAALLVVPLWAVLAAGWLRVPYGPAIHDSTGISDERAFWSWVTGQPHPILAEDFAQVPMMSNPLHTFAERGEGTVVAADQGAWRAFPVAGDRATILTCCIGTVGMLTPLDVRVHDHIGLSNPLAAHVRPFPHGRPGHDKYLPSEWEVAAAGSPGERYGDARRALACPGIRRLLASVRHPLTFDRFWDNLTGAFDRSALRYSADPAETARACGAAPS
ncbi:beta-(1-_2)-arabinofuranosyltransferase [Amycolatopsis cihanbeyliensis]